MLTKNRHLLNTYSPKTTYWATVIQLPGANIFVVAPAHLFLFSKIRNNSTKFGRHDSKKMWTKLLVVMPLTIFMFLFIPRNEMLVPKRKIVGKCRNRIVVLEQKYALFYSVASVVCDIISGYKCLFFFLILCSDICQKTTTKFHVFQFQFMFQYEMRHKGMRQRSKLMGLGSCVFWFVGDYGGGGLYLVRVGECH